MYSNSAYGLFEKFIKGAYFKMKNKKISLKIKPLQCLEFFSSIIFYWIGIGSSKTASTAEILKCLLRKLAFIFQWIIKENNDSNVKKLCYNMKYITNITFTDTMLYVVGHFTKGSVSFKLINCL